MRFAIRGLAFHGEGVTVDYVVPEQDLRANGLVQNRVLLIPAIEDYAGLLDDLVDAAQALLGRAVDDFHATPAEDPDEDVETDEPSPWDNPNERDISTSAQTTQEGDRP